MAINLPCEGCLALVSITSLGSKTHYEFQHTYDRSLVITGTIRKATPAPQLKAYILELFVAVNRRFIPQDEHIEAVHAKLKEYLDGKT